jgi:dynein light intermediate chain
MASLTESLVKYDTPILVSTSLNAQKGKGKKGGKPLAPLEKAGTTRNEDYLNSILPPREYTEGGQLWVRYVSPTPATRVDVINLQDELDVKFQNRQARETGICAMREELYSQCFDELIRQITINCAERGFLLVRVRDELKMTIQAYQTLYESSIAYGMRKALMAEQKKNEMQTSITQLRQGCDELENEVQRLDQAIIDLCKKDEEDRQREQKAHEDQVEYLKALNADYKKELEDLLSTKPGGK